MERHQKLHWSLRCPWQRRTFVLRCPACSCFFWQVSLFSTGHWFEEPRVTKAQPCWCARLCRSLRGRCACSRTSSRIPWEKGVHFRLHHRGCPLDQAPLHHVCPCGAHACPQSPAAAQRHRMGSAGRLHGAAVLTHTETCLVLQQGMGNGEKNPNPTVPVCNSPITGWCWGALGTQGPGQEAAGTKPASGCP